MADGLILRRNVLTNTFQDSSDAERLDMSNRSLVQAITADNALLMSTTSQLNYDTVSFGLGSIPVDGDYVVVYRGVVQRGLSAMVTVNISAKTASYDVFEHSGDYYTVRAVCKNCRAGEEINVSVSFTGRGIFAMREPVVELAETWNKYSSGLKFFDSETAPDSRFSVGSYSRVYEPR